MMEPSNLDHHHHEELHGGSSSFPPPSLHLVGGSHDQWNPNLIVNGGGDFISSSRDFKINNETPLPIIQDLGFHWGGNAETFMNHSAHQSTSEDLYHLPSTSYIKHEHQKLHEMSEGLLGLHPQVDGSYLASLASFAGNMSPSIPPSYSMPLASNIDLQPLDLLASSRFGRSFCEPSLNSNMTLLREENSTFGFSHLQGPCNSYHKVSTLVGGVTESKRGNNVLEQRASQAASKKPRFEARSSFSPFKVRKEKLGDRIAALQQLVAPFGKTDTASVLMEAIGYIKFLHDQVEKLSVPYMRSSNNIHLRITQGASSKDKDEGPDLRSRGLCLVPLSYTSFVTKRMEEFGLHQTNYEPM